MDSCEYVIFMKMLEQIQGSMQSAEEKRHASVSELAAKHQKVRKRKSERKCCKCQFAKVPNLASMLSLAIRELGSTAS